MKEKFLKIKQKFINFKIKYIDPFTLKVKNFYNRHEYLKVFTLIFLVAFCLFSPFSIPNGLTLPMNGDYCLQQLHFYCEAHDAIWHFFKTGEVVMWSSEGFLGVNYFAANTFYYLSSPFLLPFIFVPKILIPQLIFIMMLVKIATGGLFFYILLKKYFNTTDKTAFVGGFAYALSGWGMYYLWFNHFHDVLAVFPLLLIGIEHVLQKKKGWLLSISLMIIGMANYFFLFGFCILGVFYAIFRYFNLFKANKGHNLFILGNGIISYALGILMVAWVLLPAFNIVTDVSRVEDSSLLLNMFKLFFENPVKTENGYNFGNFKSWGDLTSKENLEAIKNYFFVFSQNKDDNLRYMFTPLSEILFPSLNNWDATIFRNPYFDNMVSSMWVSLPVLLLLVIKVIRTIRAHNPWSIIWMIITISLPFIPFVYYVLGAFSIVYGRWELFLVAIIIINAIPLLDNLNDIKKWELDLSFGIVSLLIGASLFVAIKLEGLDPDQYRPLIVTGIIIYYLYIYFYLRRKSTGDSYYKEFCSAIMVELVLGGCITTIGQGQQNYWTLYGSQSRLNEQRKLINEINKEDDDYFRIENTLTERDSNNLSMTLGYNGISTFHSVYNKELFKFINEYSKASYSYSNWSMGIDEKRAYLDQFLGVKYFICEVDDNNIPFGYSLKKSGKYFNVYENDNFVELGYSVTNIINDGSFYFSGTHFNYEAALLNTAVVENDIYAKLQEENEELNYISNSANTFIKSSNNVYKYISREKDDQDSETFTSIYNINNYLNSDRNGNLFGPWVENNLPGDIIEITKESGTPLVPNGNHHVIVKLCYGPNVEIRMYNKENEVVVKDTHGINYYDHGGDHKYARGFYVDEEIYRIEIEPLNDCPVSHFTKYGLNIFYSSYDSYLTKVEKMKNGAVSNVSHTKNTFNFETNYEKKEFVALTIPIDQGWTLYCDGKEIEKIKCNGGFIGFIAESGHHEYFLTYQTPMLIEGVGVSIGAGIIFFILTFSSFYVIKIEDKKLKVYKKKESLTRN